MHLTLLAFSKLVGTDEVADLIAVGLVPHFTNRKIALTLSRSNAATPAHRVLGLV
jgi:hypothetical protein